MSQLNYERRSERRAGLAQAIPSDEYKRPAGTYEITSEREENGVFIPRASKSK